MDTTAGGMNRVGMGTERKVRVLYLGVGDHLSPSTGMDVVGVGHLNELRASDRLDVDALIVTLARSKGDTSDEGAALLIPADPSSVGSSCRGKLRTLIDMLCGRGLPYRGFWSSAARQMISRRLREPADVIVVDHYIAMANIRFHALLPALLIRRIPLVLITHNVTPKSIWDAAALSHSWKLRLLYRVQAVQAAAIESLLVRLAARAVFLSTYDLDHYRRAAGRRGVALFPVPTTDLGRIAPITLPEASGQPQTLVFLGSPGFEPNARAIEWIDRALAPALRAIDCAVQIVLVGKGTDRLTHYSRNVSGLGFVSDAELRELLGRASACLSPVIYGSGIKVKVLDAIRAGCPVLATPESLRGFEFMAIEPSLEIGDPQQSAERVAAFVEDPLRVEAERARIAQCWSAYREERRGRLVEELVASARVA